MIFFFFFNDTATTEIYTLSLHDALPISQPASANSTTRAAPAACACAAAAGRGGARSPAVRSEEHTSELSHLVISYAVFCLKKKKIIDERHALSSCTCGFVIASTDVGVTL